MDFKKPEPIVKLDRDSFYNDINIIAFEGQGQGHLFFPGLCYVTLFIHIIFYLFVVQQILKLFIKKSKMNV